MTEQLKKGAKLLWYRIDSVLGRGGFGITYLATDTNLQTKVAIKEYLPADIAERKQDSIVIPKTGTDGELYRWGLSRFIEEARTLAKFKHHNIVRVHSVFEENNTAYMVMEYEQGNDLELMLRTPQYQSEQRLIEIFDAIMSGLEQVHAHNIIHRDIKPSNIYIREDGSPVLLDFGSARQHVVGKSQNMTRIMTKGYAPYEQMDESGGDQGPWTDIYAIGASLYYAIAREVPTDSFSRFSRVIQKQPDPLVPARELPNASDYSKRFLNAIDQALQFDATDRPQSIAEFRVLLLPGAAETPHIPVPTGSSSDDPTVLAVSAYHHQQTDLSGREDKTHYGESSPAATPAPVHFTVDRRARVERPETGDGAGTGSGGLNKGLIAGIAAAVLLILGGGIYFLLGTDSTPTNQSVAVVPEASVAPPVSDNTDVTESSRTESQQAEADRLAAEKVLEAERAAEQARLEEQQRQAEQQRLAEVARIEKEQKIQAERERMNAELARQAELEKKAAEERQKAELQRQAEEAKQAELDELQRLQQEQAVLEQKRAEEAESNRLEEERLAELKLIEQREQQRLVQLQKEEEEAARKAEAARVEEQKRREAEQKNAQEKQRLALIEKQKTTPKPQKKTTTKSISKAELQERQLQDQESDIQSVSRLFNDLKIQLGACDTQSLANRSKAQKTSLALVQSLCKEYNKMDLGISNFQSNPKRGVASANIKIRRLTSNSGDTVLPSKNWDTLPIKTVKSDGYWSFVEW